MPIEATACGAVQHKRFFSYRLRSDLYGLAYTSVAAIANQKTLCKMWSITFYAVVLHIRIYWYGRPHPKTSSFNVP